MTRAFHPIDPGAKSGAFHLLKDERGHQHCGQWNQARRAFTYAGGRPIAGEVRAYAARLPHETEGAA